MERKLFVFIVVVACLFSPAVVFSASPWMDKETYSEQAAGKFEFGIQNTLLGFTDLVQEPQRYKREGKGLWKGIGKGLIDAVVNTVGGAFQLATFPFPFDFPLPEDGVNLE